MFTRALIATLLVGASGAALAAPSIEAYVDRTQLTLDDRLTLTVEIQADRRSGGNVDAPSLEQWSVIGRFESSSYDSRRRGQVKRIQLTLQPEVAGEHVIGAFSLTSGGKVVKSEPIKVTVKGERATVTPQPTGDLPDQVAFLRWEINGEALAKDEPFEVWSGGQLHAELVAYYRADLRLTGLDAEDVDLEGFWYEENKPREEARITVLGERRFIRHILADYQVVPLRSGAMALPRVPSKLRLSRGSLFQRRSQRFERAAPPTPLRVKPLPQEGRPAGFKGAVGRVRLSVEIDRRKVDINEGVQLVVKTHIRGMIQSTPALTLPDLPDARVYPPSEEVKSAVRGDGQLRGQRTQAWLIKPYAAGALDIPVLELPYFDPEVGAYKIAKTKPARVQVTGVSRTGPPDARPRKTKVEVAAQGPKLRTIREAPRLEADTEGRLLPLLITLLSPLAFLLPLGVSGWRRRRDDSAEDRAARRALGQAHGALDKLSASKEGVYAELSRIAMAYLQARFKATLSGHTHGQLKGFLKARGLAGEPVEALITQLENCDFARFAPRHERDDAREAITRMGEVLEGIEKEASR